MQLYRASFNNVYFISNSDSFLLWMVFLSSKEVNEFTKELFNHLIRHAQV